MQGLELDNLDKLAKPKVQSLDGDALSLHQRIMQELNDVVEQDEILKTQKVFRLCSVCLTDLFQENLGAHIERPYILPDGLSDGSGLLGRIHGLSDLIQVYVGMVLSKSGQLEYLRANAEALGEWIIFVDFDFYYERLNDQVGFHKDTIGRSLFVNLNFNNTQTIMGPEYVLNPAPVDEHDRYITEKLPQVFLEHITAQRQKIGTPAMMHTTYVKPYGMVSFIDELIHHSTPYLDHRGLTEKQLDSALCENPQYLDARTVYVLENIMTGTSKARCFTGEDLQNIGIKNLQLLEYLFEGTSGFVTTGQIIAKLRTNGDYLAYKEGVASKPQSMELVKFARSQQHFQKADLRRVGVSGQDVDLMFQHFNKRNLDTVSLAHCEDHCHLTTNAQVYSLPPLKRRMSIDLSQGKIPLPLAGKRQFIRTWVQAVKK